MIRVLIAIVFIACIYFIIKGLRNNSPFEKCRKCDGMGYWIATRGEKEKCNLCKGSGQVYKTH